MTMEAYQIHQGDALSVLRTMESDSVDCCITSPPYWGLRDYGTGEWIGGDTACDNKGPPLASSKSTLGLGKGASSHESAMAFASAAGGVPFRSSCSKCSAIRVDQQIGLESTPEEFTARLVEVFREVRRVLKPDGTCWVNLGDSYNAYNGNRGKSTSFQSASEGACPSLPTGSGLGDKALKPKDLCGIPWRVAFALQADGWWLRQDIIWAKSNPMPESVTDRCTKSHEYLFLLTKSAKYFYNADAIREPNTSQKQMEHNQKYAKPYAIYDDRAGATGQPGNVNNVGIHSRPGRDGRNKRSVWNLTALPTPEAHFATFPLELPETCLLAGSRPGGLILDPFCGAGTTILAALKNGRRAVGIELSPTYVELAHKRIRRLMPLFCESQPVSSAHSPSDAPTCEPISSLTQDSQAHHSANHGLGDEQGDLWVDRHE